MLYIFDQQKGRRPALSLILDCVLSLLRQWTFQPRTGTEISSAPVAGSTADHVPLFETFDTFQLRTSAIIHGALLTLILFYLTVFGIRYSWIHVLNIRIPEIGTNPTESFSGDFKKSSAGMQIDVIPTESGGPQSKTSASDTAHLPAAPVRPHVGTIWLDQYVGKYISNNPPTKIGISIERDPFNGDHLSLSLAGAGHSGVALSPVSSAKFVLVGAENSYVEFTIDVHGKICCLSLVESGKVVTARRR